MIVKGAKGQLKLDVHANVEVAQEGDVLTFAPRDGAKHSRALLVRPVP